LREWRQRRHLSQLDLASDAEISARHLSFVETGRAAPSREMVLKLAERLEVPLRERNVLLVAAGFSVSALLMPTTVLGGLLPSVVFVSALTLGQVLIVPTVRAWVPDLVDDRQLGLFGRRCERRWLCRSDRRRTRRSERRGRPSSSRAGWRSAVKKAVAAPSA
jgi:transcriptional regulator with XRE-family HTH domain